MIRLHAVWDCIKYFPAQDLFLYSDLSDPHSNLSEFLPTTLTREDGCPVHWLGVIRPGHVWVISLINILRPLDISKWICQNIIIFVMLGLYWHVYTSPGQLEIFIFTPSRAMRPRTYLLPQTQLSWKSAFKRLQSLWQSDKHTMRLSFFFGIGFYLENDSRHEI